MNPIVSTLGPEGMGSYEVDWSISPPSFTRVSKPPEMLVVPGFVDIHIHGGFGVDWMSATTEEMVRLASDLDAVGYEAFFPTTVSAEPAAVLAALCALPELPCIPGFHLEGPFISPLFPGAQPIGAIQGVPEAGSEWDEILNHPKLRIVTLAPEIPHALELILSLRARGVLVGIGHTNATDDEARRGYEFGATHTTHTFNAMRGFHHRETGASGYALRNGSMAAELIYDRHHVSREAAELLFKCKEIDKVIAVSDATKAAGMPSGQIIEMWGHRCEVFGGAVRLADSGALAGSAITLLNAFRNLAEDFGQDCAIRACCINPRILLGWHEPPKVYLEFDSKLELIGRRVQSA